MSKPGITVYITCYNYGRYLSQAIESVLAQTRTDWELIIINDCSEDDTDRIAARYQAAYPDRIRVICNAQAQGLLVSANQALREALGQYVMRLDADDYLDENALLVMAHHLDQHPDVALVYPNFTYVDRSGNFLGVEQRKRVGTEAKLLDLPALGAGTMVRNRVLKCVGGYDERYDRQDSYELWMKVVNRFQVANVPTPLFFYRKHDESLTRDEAKLLETRARIKRAHVQRNGGPVSPRVVAVIGAKNTYSHLPNIVLAEVLNRPLIDYTLDAAFGVVDLEAVVVSTDDQAVVDYCRDKYPEVKARMRPSELSDEKVTESLVVNDAVEFMEKFDIYPDIIASLNTHSPLRKREHIQKAIDTLLIYNSDSVVSVYEDSDLYYVHTSNGLEPLNPARHRKIRVEREAFFVDNGAIRVLWRDFLSKTDIAGRRVGHIVMAYEDSFRIKKMQDIQLIEYIMNQRERSN